MCGRMRVCLARGCFDVLFFGGWFFCLKIFVCVFWCHMMGCLCLICTLPFSLYLRCFWHGPGEGVSSTRLTDTLASRESQTFQSADTHLPSTSLTSTLQVISVQLSSLRTRWFLGHLQRTRCMNREEQHPGADCWPDTVTAVRVLHSALVTLSHSLCSAPSRESAVVGLQPEKWTTAIKKLDVKYKK